jgi:hypothetical protein
MSGLKPCPFCGGEAKEEEMEFCTRIVCQTCYAEARAVDDWNTRKESKTFMSNDYVAWLKFDEHRLKVCSSVDSGAFKVYRMPPDQSARIAELEAIEREFEEFGRQFDQLQADRDALVSAIKEAVELHSSFCLFVGDLAPLKPGVMEKFLKISNSWIAVIQPIHELINKIKGKS